MRSQKFNYIYALILIFVFVLAFQNCTQNDDNGPIVDKLSVKTTTDTSSTTTTTLSTGDKAVFKLSDKYGGDSVSKILWQADVGSATRKENSIEVNWDDFSDIKIEAFIQVEENECIIYRQLYISKYPTLVSDPAYILKIISTPSPDNSPEKQYFPIDTPVDLNFKAYDAMRRAPEDFNSFQWSIKKQFTLSGEDDQTELADQTNKTKKLTHTFSETGLYNISVNASTASNETFSPNTQLMIGRCEGDDLDDVEIILTSDSIGSQTPKESIRPIWNYIRPADTDSNVDITTLTTDNIFFGGHVYKYPRSSSSKFIDMNIQNADECFLDTQPVETCQTNPNDCTYEIRENLSALSSCNGNALDMSTLDKDKTQCTDDVFVVAASKTGQNKMQQAFYKHCPADQDYCYFGEENDRPSDHNCPSS